MPSPITEVLHYEIKYPKSKQAPSAELQPPQVDLQRVLVTSTKLPTLAQGLSANLKNAATVDSEVRVVVNGIVRLSNLDYYRYYECLVHPAFSLVKAERVLILGGATGLAVREALKYKFVEEIDVVAGAHGTAAATKHDYQRHVVDTANV